MESNSNKEGFIPAHGGYRTLLTYKKAEIMMAKHNNTAVMLTVALINITKTLKAKEIKNAVETLIAPEGSGLLGLNFLSISMS